MVVLASRVSSKLEEGDFKGAVRLACSKATIADTSDSTFEALKQKHSSPHPNTSILSSVECLPTIFVTVEEIINTIRSFPNGTAGGPDGLRPQHLKDLTGATTNGGAQALL